MTAVLLNGVAHTARGRAGARALTVSPIASASRVRTPMLVLHGQEDTNAPVGQASCLHRALRRFGVEHGFVV